MLLYAIAKVAFITARIIASLDYFSSPGLSWNSMLKMTDINFELISHINMYQIVEKELKGGISYIACRHAKANNKYMKKYNKNKPSMYITYQDCNNLYGFSMSQYLPYGNFKWLTEKQSNKLDLAKYKDDSKKGLFLKVDFKYSKELHDLHNEYPCGPEKMKVTKDMLSEYAKNIADKFKVLTGLVIPTLGNKEKYVLSSIVVGGMSSFMSLYSFPNYFTN